MFGILEVAFLSDNGGQSSGPVGWKWQKSGLCWRWHMDEVQKFEDQHCWTNFSSLYPSSFTRSSPLPSFDVWDLDTVDREVAKVDLSSLTRLNIFNLDQQVGNLYAFPKKTFPKKKGNNHLSISNLITRYWPWSYETLVTGTCSLVTFWELTMRVTSLVQTTMRWAGNWERWTQS